MNRLRKIIKNSVISFLGQGVTWTSTIVLTMMYGRFLGDVKFGELYFAIAFVGLIGFPIDAGFNQQLTRDVAQEPSKALRYVTNILCLKLLMWIILYGVILLLSWRLGHDAEVRTIVTLCGISLLTSSITSLMSSLHYAFERVVFPVVGNILEKGLDALVGAILLLNGADVKVMALVLVGGSCVNMLWQTAAVIRLVGIPLTIDIPIARSLLRTSIPFILYGALAVIYYRIDTIMLSMMTSNAVVGWYGAAYRLFDTLVFLPNLVINAIMYPVFSKLSAHSESELKHAVEKSLNFLLFCGIPITIGLIVAAPSIIGFLYHQSGFDNAVPAMQYLAPGLLFLYINCVLTSVIISTGREKKITIMAAIALVFNLGLNFLLLPHYQHIGAALVTSLTEALLMFAALVFIPRSLWPTGSVILGIKAFAAGAVMGVVIWFMREYTLPVIIPVAAVVYFSTATLLGTIPREDMNVLLASIRRKTGGTKETTSEDDAFLTEEEAQQTQELQLVLAHEMTTPLIPAFKFEVSNPALIAYKREMTNPRLPAFRSEMTRPLLPTYRRDMQLPSTPRRSKTEIEREPTVLLDAVVPIELRKTWDLPNINDEEATLLLNTVQPTKDKNAKDSSR